MASGLTYKNRKCIEALDKLPKLFTLADFREQCGITSYGPDWAACAATLQAFKRQGMIENIPGSKSWKKIQQST